MKSNEELDQARDNLKEMLREGSNKKYKDWDSIIIQLMNEDKGVINSRIMRQDIEAMANLHAQDRKDIVDLLISAMEDELANKPKK